MFFSVCVYSSPPTARQLEFVTRAVSTGLETGSLDVIKPSPINTKDELDNFMFGESGAGNNRQAKAHYTSTKGGFFELELFNRVLDARGAAAQIESCDCSSHPQISDSRNSGTDAGASLLGIMSFNMKEYNDS